jgi:hypothetical protein
MTYLAGKFPLVSMGGQANGQAYADGEHGFSVQEMWVELGMEISILIN